MYNVKEVAQKMSLSDCHRRRLLESRQIEGKKPGNDWIVDRKMQNEEASLEDEGDDELEEDDEIDFLEPGVTYRRPSPKIGRNEPCPCGSGKKYKKCHGK